MNYIAMAEALEAKARNLRELAAQQEQEQEAYKNGYEAFFDGLKFVGDPDKPFAFVSPMAVQPNLYYTRDGVRYVCVKRGICTDDNFAEYMEQF